MFCRLEAGQPRKTIGDVTPPFHFLLFTPIYPPDKHTYTSNFISEVKFNHLGKGSASLKALTRTLNFRLFFTPKVLINRHKSDMG